MYVLCVVCVCVVMCCVMRCVVAVWFGVCGCVACCGFCVDLC